MAIEKGIDDEDSNTDTNEKRRTGKLRKQHQRKKKNF